MSKKLIAVAAAAALALTGLVATTPATALPVVGGDAVTGSYLAVTTTGTRLGAGTSASPFTLLVPESGTIATDANVFSLSVSSTLKTRPVAVTGTNGVKVLDELGNATNKYIASSGKDSLALTTTSSGTLNFIAFPTSTATGVLTVSITATDGTVDITQVFIKGLAGAAYAIKSVTPPTSVQPEGKGTFVAVLVDAFGNAVETQDLDVTVVGGGASTFQSEATNADGKTGTTDKISWSGTTKRHAGVLTAGKVDGTIAIQAVLAGEATTAQKAAFGTPVRTFFTTITTASLAAKVTALETEVAALKATMADMRTKARSVTKKKYNTLARKWNAANPSARVALKK